MFDTDHLITALARERTARREAEERVEKLRAALEGLDLLFDFQTPIQPNAYGIADPSAFNTAMNVADAALREVPAS